LMDNLVGGGQELVKDKDGDSPMSNLDEDKNFTGEVEEEPWRWQGKVGVWRKKKD